MTEQEAQEPEWQLEPEYTGSLDPKYHRFKIVTNERSYGDQGDIVTLRSLPKSVADRILANHKAQQEVRELRMRAGQWEEATTAWSKQAADLTDTIADLRAQLQAAEAERGPIYQGQTASQWAMRCLGVELSLDNMQADLTTTTTLLQQARDVLAAAVETTSESWWTRRDEIIAAIDAHGEKGGDV